MIALTKEQQIILTSLLDQCDIHVKRMSRALDKTKHLYPFKAENVALFAENDLDVLEVLTGRFSKLQDRLVAKLFPLILQILKEDVSESSIDRLNKLEKLNLIESSAYWQDMRDVRNNIIHDYPEPELIANNLNSVTEYAKYLLNFWQYFREYIVTIAAK